MEQLRREIDLKKRTLANDRVALELKREEDVQKISQGDIPRSLPKKKARSTGAKKTALHAPKPNQDRR